MGRKHKKEGIDIHISDSLRCTTDTNKFVKQVYATKN